MDMQYRSLDAEVLVCGRDKILGDKMEFRYIKGKLNMYLCD